MAVAYPRNKTKYYAIDAGAFNSTRTNGVFSTDEDFVVTSPGGLTSAVSAGKAWMALERFWGVVFYEDTETILEHEFSSPYYPRIDRIVLRIDYVIDKPVIAIKTGTPASNPVAPEIQRNAEMFELAICDRTVPAGASNLTDANSRDLRMDENLCGIMRDAVTKIPTQSLLDSWWAWFRETQTEGNLALSQFKAWIEYWQRQINDDFIEWYATWKSEITQVVYSWYNDLRRESEAEIQRLIDDLRGMLDNDMGTALYKNLDGHKRTMPRVNPSGVHGIRFRYDKFQIDLGYGWYTAFEVKKGLTYGYVRSMRKSYTWWAAQQYTYKGIAELVETDSYYGLSYGYMRDQAKKYEQWSEDVPTYKDYLYLTEEEWTYGSKR